VHDAFAAAVRGRAAYRGDGSVEAWLWRAVVNAALRVRSRQPAPGAVAIELPDVPGSNGNSRDELAEVRAAVAALPERQRLVLFLRYYADMDYQQIAETIGVRRGTVSAALHAAHNALRPTLEGARL
jgi:RNA polymerase sigma factor (sigma-70 family)